MKRQLLILLMLMPLMANADDPVEINGIWYNLINKGRVAEVTSGTTKYTGDVVIPATIKYEDVTYSVTTIGSRAFQYCLSLTSVTIPNSVTSIGESTFQYCSSLTSVTIGNSVTSIGEYAFAGCSNMDAVYISDITAWFGISFGSDGSGYNYVKYSSLSSNPLSVAHHLFLNGSEVKDLVIPSTVTSIKNYTFEGCSSLTSVTIPNSVVDIGERAFSGCSSLTSVTIGNSVPFIKGGVFSGCSSLTSVTIPNNVTSIGGAAFEGCSSLTSVTIPKRVSSIGPSAFKGCSSLTSVTFNGGGGIAGSAFEGCSSLTSVTIPNSMISIGVNAFKDCSGLTSVTIGNSMKSIEGGAFYRCSSLTSVTIPNSVISIGGGAFQYCSSLTSVTIGNSVTSIGYSAFEYCSSLKTLTIGSGIQTIETRAIANCENLADVYCHAEKVPSTGADAFDGSYIEYAKLHVPEGSVDLYKAIFPWRRFGTLKPFSGEGGEEGEQEEPKKCEKPTISYRHGELSFASATEGVNFVSDITDSDIKMHYGSKVNLSVTYTVSVYATKAGYENSETAIATLCWIDVDPKTEGIDNGVANVKAMPVLIQGEDGVLHISGVPEGTAINVYEIGGQLVGSAKASSDTTVIPTTLPQGSIAIVKIGEKAVKVLMK